MWRERRRGALDVGHPARGLSPVAVAEVSWRSATLARQREESIAPSAPI